MEQFVDEARSWQRDAFNAGKDARFFVCQAPGGSGKSKLQCFLGAAGLRADPAQKQLIVVPQGHISQGFSGDGKAYHFRLDSREDVQTWQVSHDFCSGSGVGRRLREFLLTDANAPGNPPTAVATHMGLVRAWDKLTDAEKQRAVHKLTLRVDEAHHVSGVVLDEEGTDSTSKMLATKLGEICRYIVNSDDSSGKLHFTTATFFRGDRADILSEVVGERFVTYSLPWDVYWPTLGITELTIDYINYGNDPIDVLVPLIRDEPSKHHLIIVPSRMAKYRDDSTVGKLIQRLRTIYSDREVLDLVTKSTQAENKIRLLRCPEQFHVIIACRLFNEGTDWVICDRLHNTDACEHSLTLAVQRFFRPLRKHRLKSSVKMYHYLPEFDVELTNRQRRELLSSRSNAILSGVFFNLELSPIFLPHPVEEDGPGTSLQSVYGPETYREVVEETANGLLAADPSQHVLETVADSVRKKFGTPEGVNGTGLGTALAGLARRVLKHNRLRPLAGLHQADMFDHELDILVEKKRLELNFLGTKNIDRGVVEFFAGSRTRGLSSEDIQRGIREFHARTGKRPTRRTGFIPELGITSVALYRRLRKLGLSMEQHVEEALGPTGGSPDDLLCRARDAIAKWQCEYGVRLTHGTRLIPELGMSGQVLDKRLRQQGITLSRLADEVLGTSRNEVYTLEEIKRVVRLYLERDKIRLTTTTAHIPELGISGSALEGRLRNMGLGLSLAKVVDQCSGVVRAGLAPMSLRLIHKAIQFYLKRGIRLHTEFGRLPEFGGVTCSVLNYRLKKVFDTTLRGEVERLSRAGCCTGNKS